MRLERNRRTTTPTFASKLHLPPTSTRGRSVKASTLSDRSPPGSTRPTRPCGVQMWFSEATAPLCSTSRRPPRPLETASSIVSALPRVARSRDRTPRSRSRRSSVRQTRVVPSTQAGSLIRTGRDTCFTKSTGTRLATVGRAETQVSEASRDSSPRAVARSSLLQEDSSELSVPFLQV